MHRSNLSDALDKSGTALDLPFAARRMFINTGAEVSFQSFSPSPSLPSPRAECEGNGEEVTRLAGCLRQGILTGLGRSIDFK